MDAAEYARCDALGLAQLIARGEITAAEALAAAQSRAREVNPSVNAIVRCMDAEAEERLREPLDGPFAGVPFLLKDLGQEYAGVPTSYGNRALAKVPAREHSTVVVRWLQAGLVPFGKTNVPELGMKGITEPELWGPARNPWDLQRTPGGSSGGSAAAVAAGIVPAAGASDGGGSIRIPAACCGVFGLKATRGLLPPGPRPGEPPEGAAVEGVVSRSVRDTAAMLDVLAGPDATAPFAPAMPDGPLLAEVGRDPGRLRIGFQIASAINPNPHASAVAAVTAAAALLEELGHEFEPVEPPVDDSALARDFLTMYFANAAYRVADIRRTTGARDDSFEQDTLILSGLGVRTRAPEHVAALERRHGYVRGLAAFHERYDLLMTPTLATPPPLIGEFETPRALRPLAALLVKTRSTGVLMRIGMIDKMVEDNLGWVPY